MRCPLCKKKLEKTIINKVEVDVCPICLGIWFERNEFRWAKDDKDKNLKWVDIDLWDKEINFKLSPGNKLCPSCRLPLYEVNYGDSRIKVDLCNLCHGIWLDRGEFKKIINYLKEEEQYRVLNDYVKNLIEEGFEIFVGPETVREEMEDFLTILKLLRYKFATQWPHLTKVISDLPK